MRFCEAKSIFRKEKSKDTMQGDKKAVHVDGFFITLAPLVGIEPTTAP